MIRNVVMGHLSNPDDPEQQAILREGLALIAAIDLPGRLSVHVGTDAGLREGNWHFAITNDWQDADTYRAYDADPEHNRIRRDYFAVICDNVARAQFEIAP